MPVKGTPSTAWLEQIVRKASAHGPPCRNRGCSTCGGSLFFMSIAEATNNVLGKPFSRKLDAEAAEFLMTCLARLEPVKTEEPVPRMEPDQVVVCIILDFLRFNDLAPHKVEAYLAGSWAGQVVAEEKRFRWPVRAEQ